MTTSPRKQSVARPVRVYIYIYAHIYFFYICAHTRTQQYLIDVLYVEHEEPPPASHARLGIDMTEKAAFCQLMGALTTGYGGECGTNARHQQSTYASANKLTQEWPHLHWR